MSNFDQYGQAALVGVEVFHEKSYQIKGYSHNSCYYACFEHICHNAAYGACGR